MINFADCPQETLKREIREELDAEIEVKELLETVEWHCSCFFKNFEGNDDLVWFIL